MRTLPALALALALAVFPAGADARRHKPKATCTPHGSKTIEASPNIRVFSLLGRGGDSTDFYACRLKTRKRFLMGSAEDLGGTGVAIGMVRIAGPFVAWDEQPFDDSERYNPSFSGFPSTVTALDTRSGAKRSAPATTGNPSSSSVGSLLLQPTGSFAWIGSGGPSGSEVHRYDASGDTVLASGTDIDSASLAASTATLYWMKGTTPVFAPFT
jgi:hypothetical protein